MGFKADMSFLRFLTMGAAGVERTMAQMRAMGFSPIELERYCSSNKIWTTKVKRLRLPDLLCIQTGLRVEVRAKSDLKIRMSDAPANPDRVWDAGLRDDDVAAFIACPEGANGPVPAEQAVFFTIRSLRESTQQSRLGPPKSASEGAERDRTWPSTVPSRNGTVVSTDGGRLVVLMDGDGLPARRQSYSLEGRHAYVQRGDLFKADVSIIAGAPSSLADLSSYLQHRYDPLANLATQNPVDRYAAVKALRFRDDLHSSARSNLAGVLRSETDERIALEAAGSLAGLQSSEGEDFLHAVLRGNGRADLRMEAIFILTELATPFARDELSAIAGDRGFGGDELRQAAVWGLGKTGLKAYRELLSYIDDPEEDVALHAIAAFGVDTPRSVIDQLVQALLTNDTRRAPAASEALRVIGTDSVLDALTDAASTGNLPDWLLATIGRLPSQMVRSRLQGTPLLEAIRPILLFAEDAHWLSTETMRVDMAFLLKQNI